MGDVLEQLQRYGDMIEITTGRVERPSALPPRRSRRGGPLVALVAVAAIIAGTVLVAHRSGRDLPERVRTTTSAATNVPTTALPVHAESSVLVVGDQVALGARDEIASRLHAALGAAVTVDAGVSRTFATCVDEITSAARDGRLGAVVIVACATNNHVDERSLDDIITTVGPKRLVYFVTPVVPRSYAGPDAALMRSVATRNKNVRIIDYAGAATNWQPHSRYFTSDGSHLTAAGKVRFADLLVDALRGGSVSPLPTSPTTAAGSPDDVYRGYLAAHRDIVVHSAVVAVGSSDVALVATATDAQHRVVTALELHGSSAVPVAALTLPAPYFPFAAASVTAGDITGDGNADFLARVDAADNEPGVVVSNDGGVWRLVPVSADPNDVYIGRNPVITNAQLTSQSNDCNPDCAQGHTVTLMWDYDRRLERFVSH